MVWGNMKFGGWQWEGNGNVNLRFASKTTQTNFTIHIVYLPYVANKIEILGKMKEKKQEKMEILPNKLLNFFKGKTIPFILI